MGGPSYVTFEGHRLDARSRDMIVAARVVCAAPLEITQGCYNAGGVAASAGTHDGGGAMDIRAKTLSDAQIKEAVNVLRHVGFAAWHRLPSEGPWVEHIHCVAVGCPDLSRGAARQVTAYRADRNGLANNKADNGPRTWVNWTWEKYKQTYPHLLTEDELSAADVTKILNAITASESRTKSFVEARTQAYASWGARHTDQVVGAAEGRADDIVQAELEEYGGRVLAAPSGTGTKFMEEVRAALKAQSEALTALAAEVKALPKAQ